MLNVWKYHLLGYGLSYAFSPVYYFYYKVYFVCCLISKFFDDSCDYPHVADLRQIIYLYPPCIFKS